MSSKNLGPRKFDSPQRQFVILVQKLFSSQLMHLSLSLSLWAKRTLSSLIVGGQSSNSLSLHKFSADSFSINFFSQI